MSVHVRSRSTPHSAQLHSMWAAPATISQARCQIEARLPAAAVGTPHREMHALSLAPVSYTHLRAHETSAHL
eukprot:13516599-Alexandrium_andersonii.AAC.1